MFPDVEDLTKKRQPLALEAVYFISPTRESIMPNGCSLLSDFSGDRKVYPAAHVFFSSHLAPDLLNYIRQNKALLKCLKTLKEVSGCHHCFHHSAFGIIVFRWIGPFALKL